MTLQDKLAYGQYGGNLISDTAAHDLTAPAVSGIGAYVCLEAQADTVIAELDTDTLLVNDALGTAQAGGKYRQTNLTLAKGMRWFGRFYRIKLTSGSVMAYAALSQTL